MELHIPQMKKTLNDLNHIELELSNENITDIYEAGDDD